MMSHSVFLLAQSAPPVVGLPLRPLVSWVMCALAVFSGAVLLLGLGALTIPEAKNLDAAVRARILRTTITAAVGVAVAVLGLAAMWSVGA